MTRPINLLRDDFANNVQDPVWANSAVTGSATKAETGGQCVLTLPSSTAGSHSATYKTPGTYDITGDGCFVTIAQMVSTSVAATAYFELVKDYGTTANALQWIQLSGSLTARKVVAGVSTTLFTVTWNAVTHKYLRIRESGGTTFFDSSTDGVTWTNRASLANPFAVTDLTIEIGAACGNVASPGAFKLDEFNTILPTTTWRWSQVERASVDYVKTVTVSASQGSSAAQGYIATSSDGVTWAYYTGPIGSASGGFDQLVLAASQAAAENMAANLPSSTYARWDLPSLVQCRFVRLYHRSLANNYRIDEFYPRRLMQSDDVEAESMKTVNFAANSVTADKIFVVNLAAINAFIGKLNIDLTGYLYQGTGTGDAPTTGLKIYNSGGIGKLSTYNATVEQISIDTDGALKAGAGALVLDATGIAIIAPSTTATNIAAYKFTTAAGVVLGGMYAYDLSGAPNVGITVPVITGKDSTIQIAALSPSAKNAIILIRAYDTTNQIVGIQINSSNLANGYYGKFLSANPGSTQWSFQGGVNIGSGVSGAADGDLKLSGAIDAINVGSESGAASGTILASGSIGVNGGLALNANVRVAIRGGGTSSSTYGIAVYNSANATNFYVRDDGVGVLRAASWTYTSDERMKENISDFGAGLDEILLLNPQRFDYIDGQKNQLGFVAQDIQKVLPELVHVMEDGMLGIQTGNLIPILVVAVQALSKRLLVLENN